MSYLPSFYFKLSFSGEDAAFQEVSGISKELSLEEVAGGGENRFKYRLPTIPSSQNLILKRALVPVGSKLALWCATTLGGDLVNPIKTQTVMVSLMNSDGMVATSWTFYDSYPVKYSVSELKSDENNLAIETIELAYTYFDMSSGNPNS